ncbi:hypothetical protein DL96DRAFT_233067 [Flagelloscypha sp. PMI_526]|nr:hypothetical protein DL96DRAFT_233067 [Flagelloscypha sp. PMI_526]
MKFPLFIFGFFISVVAAESSTFVSGTMKESSDSPGSTGGISTCNSQGGICQATEACSGSSVSGSGCLPGYICCKHSGAQPTGTSCNGQGGICSNEFCSYWGKPAISVEWGCETGDFCCK